MDIITSGLEEEELKLGLGVRVEVLLTMSRYFRTGYGRKNRFLELSRQRIGHVP
jgi:hypothetical protein